MTIVFVVSFIFPYGDASSIRALNICRLLREAGHNVHVISDYQSADAEEADCVCSHEACFDKAPSAMTRFSVPRKSVVALKKYCETHPVDAVLCNARYERFYQIANYCKKKQIRFFVENCEWYDCSSFKLRKFDIRYYRNQMMLLHGFKKADGFLSISRLLDMHNKSFGKKSVRIPTIMDVSTVPFRIAKQNEKVSIIYTGNPGRSKELLRPVLELLAEDSELREKIRFDLYGPSREQIVKNIGGDELLIQTEQCVHIHGKIPQKQMPEIMRSADFLIFLRPDRRSSNAGFPTKLGECMAAGTPPVVNDTGDIGLYVKDGVNGFLLPDYRRETLKKYLWEAVTITEEKRQSMNLEARKTAQKAFDYRSYIDDVIQLFA